jgi:hypothetical protein
MFVSGLFKNASALATTVTAAGISGYTAYVKAGASGTGLNPAMVNSDIAVALVQVGLASLKSASANTPIVANAAALPTAASSTIGVYANPDTIISGAIFDWIYNLSAGLSTMDRLRARGLESLVIIQRILGAYDPAGGSWNTSTGTKTGSWAGGGWIAQLAAIPAGQDTWKNKDIPVGDSQGWGGTEAPRGALMHQCSITNGKITKYQCIVPTTWNGSPVSNAAGTDHGAIEKAVMGAPFAAVNSPFQNAGNTASVNSTGGVEVLRIAQSFDPCIACAVH